MYMSLTKLSVAKPKDDILDGYIFCNHCQQHNSRSTIYEFDELKFVGNLSIKFLSKSIN